MANWPVLYGTPSITKRVSIARPPAPPTEDSDVLVLSARSTHPDPSTIGARVLYLDLRLSLPSRAAINWAFAGVRDTLSAEKEGVRYRWTHAIDSNGPGGPPDVGTMIKRKGEQGDVEVEVGVGLDPETGKIGPYEEIWESEDVPLGTPFVFLTSHVDPDQAGRFMAVLGPHAMGLWQTAADDGNEFHAVRLQCNKSEEGKLPAYSKVFSTTYQTLDDQLRYLGEELLARERKGKRLWKRGESLMLKDNQGGSESIWTVWDAGRVGN